MVTESNVYQHERERLRDSLMNALEETASSLRETGVSAYLKSVKGYVTDYHNSEPARFEIRRQPKGILGDIKSLFSLDVLVSAWQFPDRATHEVGEIIYGDIYKYAVLVTDKDVVPVLRDSMEKLEEKHPELRVDIRLQGR